MRLDLDPAEQQFRDRLRAWLDATPRPDGLRDYGATPTLDDLQAGRAWQRRLHESGWAALSWPPPHGPGATAAQQAIFAEELAARGLPRQLSFVSVELAGPIIIAHGSDAQRERFLPPLVRGEHVWCQLFSEPGAGSDLAGISTRAVGCDDGWRIEGQKIWTSGAHYADFGLLLARTDPAAERHRGVTCFALPMGRRGIDVRPIRQMDGLAKFNEVFLDDVEVGTTDVLGGVGDGWRVALSILGSERRMLGSLAIGLAATMNEVRSMAEASGAARDIRFRERWAAVWARVQLLRWTWFRLLSSSVDPSDPRMSVLKLVSSELQQAVAGLGAETLGREFAAGHDGARWREAFLAAHGATIAGGTSEIQRNILGERVLGLPR